MFAYCRNNPVKRKDISGTNDLCVTDDDDDNPFNDLAMPSGGGGSGAGANAGGSGYVYGVDLSVAQRSALTTGGIYNNGFSPYGYSTGPATPGQGSNTIPSACFVAGTLVQDEDGAVPIEDIKVGDFVWAWDEETGNIALKRVVETYVNQSDELIHIFVNGEEIVTTPTHPFYSPVKGWTAACKLRAGDILVTVNGEYVVVEKIQHEILEAPITVYNFQVEGYHTYYVAYAGVLVHNNCDYKPFRNGDMRAVINPGETEAPHAHIFQKANNIGRIFSDGTMDASLLQSRAGMRFVKEYYSEIITLIGDFYGKR